VLYSHLICLLKPDAGGIVSDRINHSVGNSLECGHSGKYEEQAMMQMRYDLLAYLDLV
jgi:hypothetical protein